MSLKYLDAYKYHVEKGTALGKAMVDDPIHTGFFLNQGNVIDGKGINNFLYNYYFRLRLNKLCRFLRTSKKE